MRPHRMPDVGLPSWKYDKVNKNSQTMERRFYDAKGRVILDIDFNDHSKPKAHPMGAHSHDYINGKRGIPRKLKEWERKMIQEIQSQES